MPTHTQGTRSMSSTEELASNVVTASALAISNGAAWFSSEQVGMIVTAATVLGTLAIGLASKAIKEVSRARGEAWADRMRLEMQVRIDQEKVEANSLNGQIKSLTSKMEEMQKRVEDANKKLHDAANDRQIEVNRHHEEMQSVMKQVGDLREENRRLMVQLTAKVQANTGAIDRIVSPDAGTMS